MQYLQTMLPALPILSKMLIAFQNKLKPVVILIHNQPSTYLIPATEYEALLERLEDYELGLLVKERMAEKPQAIEVSINDL